MLLDNLQWGSVAQYLSAVGTILACIVAIWGPQIRHRLLPPRLVLTLLDPLGTESIRKREDQTVIRRWYHLRIKNLERWSPVSGVRVYLLRVELIRRNGSDIWEDMLPMNFRHEKSYNLGNTRQIGHEVDVDLFAVQLGKELTLATAFGASHGMPRSYSGPVQLRLVLQARGIEGDSNFLEVDIDWDGMWPDHPDLMPKHLKVSNPSYSRHSRDSLTGMVQPPGIA